MAEYTYPGERAELIEALEAEREISRAAEKAAEEMAKRLDRIAAHLYTLSRLAHGNTADPWPEQEQTKAIKKKTREGKEK